MPKFQWRSFTIDPYGEVVQTVHPKQPDLAWLQEQVDGWIETVPYFTKFQGRTRGTAYANEEGIIKGMPFNRTATEAYGRCFEFAQNLYGPVVITFREKIEA